MASRTGRIARIDQTYSRAMSDLTAARIEYLIADRHYLAQMMVKDGNLERDDFRFRGGAAGDGGLACRLGGKDSGFCQVRGLGVLPRRTSLRFDR